MQNLVRAIVAAAFFATPALASPVTVTTEFNTSDGFVTGGVNGNVIPEAFDDVTVDGLVTFSGGQQQQMFDGPSYSSGPAAYLFINGGGGFEGASGNVAASTGDTGLISFGGFGASSVSFFGANRANGAGTTLNVFGVDGALLTTILVTQTVNNGGGGPNVSLTSLMLGALIGSIEVDLPGPAGNPPYAFAIDGFSSVVETPLPGGAVLALTGIAGLAGLRRRRKAKTV